MVTTYSEHLTVAVDAARAAGALLLEDFSRPGGPVGEGAHADADDRAEALIRARLLEAFEDTAYLGEETGTGGEAGAEHIWLVDPNDGTSAYLRGWRGPAVSIALLRGAEPVLGVVFAYAAPDHDGDLIAWAEGCGPITRNGEPVERAPLPPALAGEHVVLIAQWADAAAEGITRLISPARFQPTASIAYRLALLAVGDGDAAVSLGAPVGWDYAAGHALLKAAGGALVDQYGEPIQYRAGRSQSFRCFGGSLEVARALAAKPWDTLGYHPFDRQALDLVILDPGENIADCGVLSRAQGCLLGQVAGDSLGSLVEFQPEARIAAAYHDGGPSALEDGGTWGTLAGQPTDDSELALMLARTLVGERRFDDDAVFEAYRFWCASGPFDIGNTTRRALGGHPNPNPDSQANGALMRVSPLGIFGASMPPAIVAVLARRDAALTHPNPVCGDASAVFASTIAYAIRTGATAQQTFDFGRGQAQGTAMEDAFGEQSGPLDGPKMGWVRLAFNNAFWQLVNAQSVEQGVIDTVRRGGDTDTNAAICGALLGAVYGRDAIPLQWRRMTLTCRPLPETRRPRSRAFWPVDVLRLAERLLCAGK